MKPLELEAEGWVRIGKYSSEYDVWGRGRERILYDTNFEKAEMYFKVDREVKPIKECQTDK